MFKLLNSILAAVLVATAVAWAAPGPHVAMHGHEHGESGGGLADFPTLANAPTARWYASYGVTDTGGAVTDWFDTTDTYNMEQNTAANRPSLNSADLNGHDTITFDDAADSGNGEFLIEASDLGITDYPYTIMFLAMSDDITSNQTVVSFSHSTTASQHTRFGFWGGAAGDPLRFQHINDPVSTTNGFSASTWYSGAAFGSAQTDRDVQRNGDTRDNDTSSRTWGTGWNQLTFGCRFNGSSDPANTNEPFSGKIAEVLIWDGVDLSAADADLVRGFWDTNYGTSTE